MLRSPAGVRPQQPRHGVGDSGVCDSGHVPDAEVGRRTLAQVPEFGAAQPSGGTGGRHPEDGARGNRWSHQWGDLHGEPGVGEQMSGVVAAASAGAETDGDSGRLQGGDRGDSPAHRQVASGRVGCRDSGCREPGDLVGRDVAQMRERDILGQPAPLVEQIDRALAIFLQRDGDIHLLVGLGASTQAVLRRHLTHKFERLARVAVYTGRPDGELQHAVCTHSTGATSSRKQRLHDGLRRRGRLLRVVARSATHEDQATAQGACRLGDRRRDGNGVDPAGPAQVVVGYRRDTVEQPLSDADGCRGERQLGIHPGP